MEQSLPSSLSLVSFADESQLRVKRISKNNDESEAQDYVIKARAYNANKESGESEVSGARAGLKRGPQAAVSGACGNGGGGGAGGRTPVRMGFFQQHDDKTHSSSALKLVEWRTFHQQKTQHVTLVVLHSSHQPLKRAHKNSAPPPLLLPARARVTEHMGIICYHRVLFDMKCIKRKTIDLDK